MIEASIESEGEPSIYLTSTRNHFVREFNKIAPKEMALQTGDGADAAIDAVIGFSLQKAELLEGEDREAALERGVMMIAYLERGANGIAQAAEQLGCKKASVVQLMQASVTVYLDALKELELEGTFAEHEDLMTHLQKMSQKNDAMRARAQALAVLFELVDVSGVDQQKLISLKRRVAFELERLIAKRAPRGVARKVVPERVVTGVQHLKQIAGYSRDSIVAKPMAQVVHERALSEKKTDTEARREMEIDLGYALEHLYGRVY